MEEKVPSHAAADPQREEGRPSSSPLQKTPRGMAGLLPELPEHNPTATEW